MMYKDKVNWFKYLYVAIFILLFKLCTANQLGDYIGYPTESSDLVEVFDPQKWMERNPRNQRIIIRNLKLETKIKLRYGKTRINLNLKNPHNKQLQSSFRIILPKDAFFTVFKLKRGNNPKLYTAQIMRKEEAKDMYTYAYSKTNGTISAGFIELSSDIDSSSSSYNLKFTLGPKVELQGYLFYERQIERRDDLYRDAIHIYPMEVNSVIQLFEIKIDIEEFETISNLQCSTETEKAFKCNETIQDDEMEGNKTKLIWRNANISQNFSSSNPFEFQYELDHSNTTSAVVMTQSNGNLYFLHLFVPQNLPPIRKHIVFLLDISDSMHGEKLDQLKWSMTEIFDDLSNEDFFTIITFSTEATVWSPFNGERKKCPRPIPVTPKYKDEARYFIDKLSAHGVTNIELGLLKAFDVIQLYSPYSTDTCDQAGSIKTPRQIRQKIPLKLPENVESMIFFLSDGIPTSGIIHLKSLLELFTNFNANLTSPVQLHSIAYGESADADFLSALAIRNNGIMKRIVKKSGAGIELTNFYTEISSQVVTKIQTLASLKLNETESIVQEHVLNKLVLVKGAEVVTAGLLFPGVNQTTLLNKPSNEFNWEINATSKLGSVRYTPHLHDCRSLKTTFSQCIERIDSYLLRLQAYQLLKKRLERDYLVQKGYLCPKPCAVDYSCSDDLHNYEENDVTECANPYKEKAIDLALKEGFVTPYTAFILSTEPQVDIGLVGKVDSLNETLFRWAKPEDENPDQVENRNEELQEIEEIHPQKLSRSELSVDFLFQTNDNNSTAQGNDKEFWLTKLMRDFAKFILKKKSSNSTLPLNATG